MNKIHKYLFGEFHTFEGDQFHWMANFGTLFLRTRHQKRISIVLFWTGTVISLITATYVYAKKPQMEIIGEYLITGSSIVSCLTLYGMFIPIYHLIANGFMLLRNLYEPQMKHVKPSQLLTAKFNAYSCKFKRYTYGCLSLVSIYYITLCFDHNPKQLCFVLLREIVQNRAIFWVPVVAFMIPHALCFMIMIMTLDGYYTSNAIFLLDSLTEYVEKLINFENGYDNEKDHLECTHYQEKIKEDMTYLCMQFVKNKHVLNVYNEEAKWPFFVTVLMGGITMSTIFVWITVEISKDVVPYLVFFITLAAIFVMLGEIGEQLQIHCENLFNAVQCLKWYQWNKSNKQLFFMLMLQSKQTFTLQCYGLAVQDRRMLLQVMQIIHAYITYCHSMKK